MGTHTTAAHGGSNVATGAGPVAPRGRILTSNSAYNTCGTPLLFNGDGLNNKKASVSPPIRLYQ